MIAVMIKVMIMMILTMVSLIKLTMDIHMTYQDDDWAKYDCNDGYHMEGTNIAFCCDNGEIEATGRGESGVKMKLCLFKWPSNKEEVAFCLVQKY